MTVERVDLVVIGAGPAGLAAAAEFSRCGGRVVVLDEGSIPGGRLLSQVHKAPRGSVGDGSSWSNGVKKAEMLIEEARTAGAEVICGASVWGVFPGWFVGVAPVDTGQANNDFRAGFETRTLLIATGAAQNPLPLSGWTLPGVITVGAAQTMINVHRVLPGKRAVVIGIDPLALSVAHLMTTVGVDVRAVVLPPGNGLQFGPISPQGAIETLSRFVNYAPNVGLAVAGRFGSRLSKLTTTLFPRDGIKVWGVPLMLRRAALAIGGQDHVESLQVVTLATNGSIEPGSEEEWHVDTVITSAGLFPLTELVQLADCPLVYVADLGGYVPVHSPNFETPVSGLFVAGSVTGIEGAAVAEAQGRVAGIAAAGYLNLVGRDALATELANRQERINAARREALPFMPNIQAGRAQMEDHWVQHMRQMTQPSHIP